MDSSASEEQQKIKKRAKIKRGNLKDNFIKNG
jgi:hypothetical protein